LKFNFNIGGAELRCAPVRYWKFCDKIFILLLPKFKNLLIKAFGFALYGISAMIITIEVNITNFGICFFIVGLADKAVKESRKQIESELVANKFMRSP
jgi:hypothetical protein